MMTYRVGRAKLTDNDNACAITGLYRVDEWVGEGGRGELNIIIH